ncbi:glycosyltransferase family 2 protein [Bacillus sp. Au-Bac7]|uniref:glycosyltransferase family 2 protein n=1 Tax=Bacillus sp. Au-Bac7 TaxID=2906458 RepID=UPI001E4C5F27|nr:glycosyltransferase family 2 protein [Bacillus sp. Au-Bac7]MCE4049561.1 glycosyltransferase [Bacillus sp. Au-Bac7]
MSELVTVIIPTYKRSDFLSRAIESVLGQTYTPIEIIVVDDNDTNSKYRKQTELLMEKYKDYKNIKYLQHEQNLNGSAARNTGIKNSNGKYIAFLDDDDEFLEKKISMQVEILRKTNKKIGAVYGGYNIIRGNKVIKRNIPLENGNLISELLQMKWGTGSGSNVLFKSEVFSNIGLFDESLKRHQDWDILLRMFREYEILSINDVLINIHKDSRINIPNPQTFLEVKEYFLSKFEGDIKKLTVDEGNTIYKMHYMEIVTAYLKSRNYKSALKYYKKSNQYSKIQLKQKITLILISIFFTLPKREFLLIYLGPLIERMRFIKN